MMNYQNTSKGNKRKGLNSIDHQQNQSAQNFISIGSKQTGGLAPSQTNPKSSSGLNRGNQGLSMSI
eukprot:CAMPEP_0168610836 /NCGR_PEP_ID=MMETSP0449_2-20121227/2013_1 /TAXON_ID=1082188 /ORGANISM="Strombidium rassoulzadegani, Strain ras09" /LENGTH=65 /DNA_ID=CAMNT_0008651195 /DNA_START=178 /DNA_END=375 /DNA_ORIENTATION=-